MSNQIKLPELKYYYYLSADASQSCLWPLLFKLQTQVLNCTFTSSLKCHRYGTRLSTEFLVLRVYIHCILNPISICPS